MPDGDSLWGPGGRPPWAPAGLSPEQALTSMARSGPPISMAGLEAAPLTLTAQMSGQIKANLLQVRNSQNPLAPEVAGLPNWDLLASRLATSPVNALSVPEVAASSATPPTAVAGNLQPGSGLASAVALMALANAGTHSIVPVDYDPFKKMEAAQAPAGSASAPGFASLARPVNLPTAVASVPPVRYVTKASTKNALSNPDLNLG